VFNSNEFISDMLLSVASQSHTDIEHIVIDGASNDGTLDILNRHRSNISVLISEPDDGIYDALNKGISCASGEIIGFLHSDDFFASEDVLTNVISIFESDPSVSAVYGDLDYVLASMPDKVVRSWRSSHFSSRLLKQGWMPPHPTIYVRKEWYDRIGQFDKRYSISADYLSILKLFSHPDFKAVYLREVMVKMRLGGISNRSFVTIFKKSVEDWNALRSCGFGILDAFYALLLKNLRKVNQFFIKFRSQ